jgi:dTDP-4-amino-4,6-dideoxygalactose transaminase
MSNTSKIKKFCQEKNIVFIEDACQSLGSSYNGIVAGTIGDISTLSFNANKVVAGISGGGAIITDGDTEIFKKLRKHGNNEILGYNSKMLLFNAEVINYRLNKLDSYIERRQEIAKQYDKALKDLVVVQSNTGGHNYHKYVIRLQNKRTRDKLKEKLGAKVHYENPISENKMYNNIKHRKDITYVSKLVSDTVLTLPIHPYMTQGEVDIITNTILIILEQDNNRFVDSMKKVIGEDIFDNSLVNETTENIYDHIVEKTYQLPEYIEEVDFKDKRKLKIAFNKFYENITTNTK